MNDILYRIADALERMAPAPPPVTDWKKSPAYVWGKHGQTVVNRLQAPKLANLRGIDAQKEVVTENIARLAAGHAAHDMLLWGARGMGKSALIRAGVVQAQMDAPENLALVQISPDALENLSDLFGQLAEIDRRFLVFIDDLGFEGDDHAGSRHLRSWLEGSVQSRAANVRIAVTSNRRAIVNRNMSEQDDSINPRDVVDDRLALADRFGLSIGFHACDQDDYLAIIAGYATEYSLIWDRDDALEWSRRRGARSGRVAWHYVTELAGRAGVSV